MTEPKIPPGQKKWERDFDLIEATMIEFFDDPKATQLLELLKQLRREHYRCAWLDEARRLHTESHAPNGDDDYALWAARHAAEAEKIAAANAEATYWEAGGMEHDTC